MSDEKELNIYHFESREIFEYAKKEKEIVDMLRQKVDLTQGPAALKVYNKFVTEKTFRTIVGYEFLLELRKVIVETGYGNDTTLGEIPIRVNVKRSVNDTMPSRPQGESKFKRLYENEKTKNIKFKIVIGALLVLLIGFTVITMKTDYSVFTYFTNYKSSMEEELIDKYEKWSQELQTRENALNGVTSGSAANVQ